MPDEEVLGEAVKEEERGPVAGVEAVDCDVWGGGDVEGGKVGEQFR